MAVDCGDELAIRPDVIGDIDGFLEAVLEPGNRYVVAVESAVKQEVLNLLRG